MQDGDQIDAACFDGQMQVVKSHFSVLPLGEALSLQDEGRLPRRALSITFDDGYLDNHSVALPILTRHRLPATFFIATGYLGRGIMFNDHVTESIRGATGSVLDLNWLGLGHRPVSDDAQRRQLAIDVINAVKYLPAAQREEACHRLWTETRGHDEHPTLMMTPEQLQDLARAGMVIGGHTHTHPILTRVPLDDARADIAKNRAVLQDIVGKTPDLFAYPNGRPKVDFDQPQRDLVEAAGYKAAVTTACGVVTRETDRYQAPRFSPWPMHPTKLVVHLLRNAWRG
jgi:peptidoglycan/xylan/chitin deacetylase (PgdA/CDA1 family)